MNVSSQIFFNGINHGYKAAIIKENSLWLLPFYMVVATYFYYEKLCRTMHTAIVSNLLKIFCVLDKEKLQLHISQVYWSFIEIRNCYIFHFVSETEYGVLCNTFVCIFVPFVSDFLIAVEHIILKVIC